MYSVRMPLCVEPPTKFSVELMCEQLNHEGKIVDAAALREAVRTWWEEFKPTTAPLTVLALWTCVTDFLTKARYRVVCTEAQCEPSPGFVYSFVPTEDRG